MLLENDVIHNCKESKYLAQIFKLRRINAKLRVKVSRTNKKVKNLNDLLANIKSKSLISDSAADVIDVSINQYCLTF